MYKKVSTSLNFVEREKETLAFWKENKIFEKSVELRRGAPAYTFFDGPPTANGRPQRQAIQALHADALQIH